VPSRTLYMGMAVPKETSAVASGAPAQGAEGLSLGTMGTRPCACAPLIRQRPAKANPLGFLDEAGPWGSWLSRSLTKKGDDGWGGAIAAPPKTGRSGQPGPERRRALGPPGSRRGTPRRRWPHSRSGSRARSPLGTCRPRQRSHGGPVSAHRLRAAPGDSFGGPGPWAPGPPQMALGSGLPAPGAPPRLARRRPCRPRAPRTPPASRTRTPSARESGAVAAGGRGAPRAPWCPGPCGRSQGDGKRRPVPL
jgi:hypothetical protein